MGYEVTYGNQGQWLVAAGDTFPVVSVSVPHNTRFYRIDLNELYRWEASTKAWVLLSAGAPGSLTVQESDGAPAIAAADTILFDQADGFVVTDLGSGDARVDLDAIPEAKVAGLVADLAAKAAAVHTHAEADVTNLVADLAGKAASVHTHAEADVTNLVADLAAKVPSIRSISTNAPLAGGGDLSANRTLSIDAATTAAVGVVELATDGEVAANVVVQGNDSRIATVVHTARNINTTAPITGGGDLSADRTIAISDATTAAKGAVELATDGEAIAGVVVQGNDARLSNARTPTAHATTHLDGGSDPFRIPPNQLPNPTRVTLTGTDRATLGSAARLTIYDADILLLGTYAPTAFSVLADEYVLQYKRLSLRGNLRASLSENSEIVLTDLKPGGRLVLSGAGGGS